MKKIVFLPLLVFAISLSSPVKGQWVVSDPAHTVETIINKILDTREHLQRWLAMLDQIKEAKNIFNQGKEWYDHLKTVSGSIKSMHQIAECADMVKDIGNGYYNAFSKIRVDPNFKAEEISGIGEGYFALIKEATNIFDDIHMGIEASDKSMTDKDRIDIVADVHRRLKEHKALMAYYTKKIISVSYVRSKEANNYKAILKLYGVEK